MGFKEADDFIRNFINNAYPILPEKKVGIWHDPNMSQITKEDVIELGFKEDSLGLSLSLSEDVDLEFSQGHNDDASIRFRNIVLSAGLSVEWPAKLNHLTLSQLKLLISAFKQ